MSLDKARELAKCKCGGQFAWHWEDKKKLTKSGFSSSVVKCSKCGNELSAKEAHEFTKAVLKQIK